MAYFSKLYSITPFEYLCPRDLDEALALLAQYGREGKVVAGGTDLIIQLKMRQINPKYLIDIQGLEELNFIKIDERNNLAIGSATTHRTIEQSEAVRGRAKVLSDAVYQLGTPQIRNVGTIGGNIANASPCSDIALPLLVLGASLKLKSSVRERVVPIEDFFAQVKKTIMKEDELLTEIIVPPQSTNAGESFIKIGRRYGHDLSVASIATILTVSGSTFQNIRIAMGSVAPTPVRLRKVERFLEGKRLSDENIGKASLAGLEEIHPISDVRASAEYRTEISKILIQRSIGEASENAGG